MHPGPPTGFRSTGPGIKKDLATPLVLHTVCYAVQNFLNSYESSKDPDILDSLIFQAVKLKRLLMVFESCNCEILENVGKEFESS